MKNVVKSKCEEILKRNEKSIEELFSKIENGGNKKSLESVICGIKKSNKVLEVIINIIDENYNDDCLNLVKKMEYNKKVELKEVDKKEVIEKDLIDKVIIKKVGGVNKYFIEV